MAFGDKNPGFATRTRHRKFKHQHPTSQNSHIRNGAVGMAAISNAIKIVPEDNESDYGSDFSPEQEQIVSQLIRAQNTTEDNPITNDIEHHGPERTLHIPRIFGRQERSPLLQAARAANAIDEQICQLVSRNSDVNNYTRKESLGLSTEAPAYATLLEPEAPDTRSPLERFRSLPKKAFSVSDLVSPAWCELQYWKTLTIHGKKRQTSAMKQGSLVHQKLENQVHTTVKVDVTTKEDAWGLRIWNVIQGLRTLRETGLTRELEIWGTVDGLVVNGIIDELSFTCPDTGPEESLQESHVKTDLAPNQATISDFFQAQGDSSKDTSIRRDRRNESKKVYICDVKTRSKKSLPGTIEFQPTRMQLMLYHKLLSELVTNTVEFLVFADRYRLDPLKVFSDSFIAQVGSLNNEIFWDAQSSPMASQESEPGWSQDSMSVLLAHNTLEALWSLMIEEFQTTLAEGSDSLGTILKAEYRSRDDGEIVGVKTFVMDGTELDKYLDHEMKWWRGERPAEGVKIEEAFKCRSCDFALGCEWRQKKEKELLKAARFSRKKSII